MPTLEELGQKVKAKYPQYSQVPDAELGAKVKAKYPDAYKDFEGTASTFDKMAVSQKAKGHLASMESGPAKKQYEQAQASATQDIKNYVGRAAGETAAMVPFAIAAPMTAGTSLAAGAGIMGAAGLASGLAREGTKKAIGSSEVPKGWDLAKAVGADVAWGASGEATGRGLFLAASQLPKAIEHAANKSAAGKALLEKAYAGIRSELDAVVGKRPVNVERPLLDAKRRLEALPEGKGAFGEQFTGLTGKAEETYSNIVEGVKAKREAAKATKSLTKLKARQTKLENVTSGVQAGEAVAKTGREMIAEMEAKLEKINGRISSHQPLDALIEIKGNAQQMAYGPTTNVRERPVFRDMAETLDKIIKEQIAGDPQAAALYKRANDLGKTVFQVPVASTMAQRFIHSYASRLVGYSIFGAGAGAYFGHSPMAAAAGAAAGAGVSVGVPKLATLILQQTMDHPKAAAELSKGIEFFMRGDVGRARDMADRAFVMAGVRETVKEWIKQNQPPPDTVIGP